MRGQKMAADYLKEQFRSFGIEPLPHHASSGMRDGYFQPFDLVIEQPGALVLQVDGVAYKFLEDQIYFSKRATDDRSFDRIWFTGESGLAGLPPEASAAMVLVPKTEPGSVAILEKLRTLTGSFSGQGGKLLLIALEDFDATAAQYAHWLGSTRMRLADDEEGKPVDGLQVMLVDAGPAMAILSHGNIAWAKALKSVRKGRAVKTRSIEAVISVLDRPVRTPIESENVLAYVEGTDKKDELVVVTAHYDHIGVHDGEVYNGADDDGSGTVALLEMAQAFAEARKNGHGPRRSVLFMPVSAEEKGLLGSEHYSEHPVFPLTSTVCNLNIDMIGRTDSAHSASPPYVYIIGSNRLSTQLHEATLEANERYVRLDLDETFNAPEDPNRFYYRSDHYNFARKGVPAVFFFSGVHEDYHQPGDEVEKIRFDLLHQRTLLVFHTAWDVANREQRLVVDGKVEKEND
ncbi:MAG: M28 family peptidase [Flavobacteriales bacterium]|nr:MAG: M28 family peptidase [Flavobacteriales bacterium]